MKNLKNKALMGILAPAVLVASAAVANAAEQPKKHNWSGIVYGGAIYTEFDKNKTYYLGGEVDRRLNDTFSAYGAVNGMKDDLNYAWNDSTAEAGIKGSHGPFFTKLRYRQFLEGFKESDVMAVAGLGHTLRANMGPIGSYLAVEGAAGAYKMLNNPSNNPANEDLHGIVEASARAALNKQVGKVYSELYGEARYSQGGLQFEKYVETAVGARIDLKLAKGSSIFADASYRERNFTSDLPDLKRGAWIRVGFTQKLF